MEGLRTPNGTFRYAEPDESDDSLCNKLTGLFEVAATSSVVRLNLKLEGLSFVDGRSTSEVNFPVGSGQSGELKRWVTTVNGDNAARRVIIDSSLEYGLSVNVVQAPGDRLEQWLSHCVDGFAVDVLALTDPHTARNDVFDLRCALLQQKMEAVLSSTSSTDLGARLKFLSEQLIGECKTLSFYQLTFHDSAEKGSASQCWQAQRYAIWKSICVWRICNVLVFITCYCCSFSHSSASSSVNFKQAGTR